MNEEKKPEPFDKDERDGMVRYYATLFTVILTSNPALKTASSELQKHLVSAHGYTVERAKSEIMSAHADALVFVAEAISTGEVQRKADQKKGN